MVDDLIELWKCIKVQTPNRILKSIIIRAALPYITCNIPGTRKICGFYGLKAVMKLHIICHFLLYVKSISMRLREIISLKYIAIYGAENVVQVPLCYTEFSQIKVLSELHTSVKSRSECSTAVIAVWPSVNGEVLTKRQPMMEDLIVGQIQFFFTHTPAIADNDLSNTFELPHVMAKVLLHQDHP